MTFVYIALSYRFFGRLARDNEPHDETTLRAIRENTDGLQGTCQMRSIV